MYTKYRSGLTGRGLSGRLAGLRAGRPSTFQQIASVVRGMGVRGETKASDIPVVQLSFLSGNNASQSLSLIQEGASFYNRIGRKVAMKSLQLTGFINPVGAAGALVEEIARYIIFYDKQPNGAAATWNNVVQAYDNAGGVTNSAYDGVNMDNRDRFVILRDRKVVFPRTSVAGIPTSVPFGTAAGSVGADGSDGGAVVKEFIKLNNLEIQFNGTANPATVAQISTGNLGIVAQGSQGGQWIMNYAARLRFTDA